MTTVSVKQREKVLKNKQTCLKVSEADELLRFLLANLENKGRNTVKALLARGQINVDGKVVTQFNHPLLPGQEVTIDWQKPVINSVLQGLKILFEDPYIIVIEKEAGLLSIATAKEREETAYSILTEHVKQQSVTNRIFIVHRLDRDTSGIMMFAKNQKVKDDLQANWKEVVLERSYVVVAEGQVAKTEGTITSWLKESKSLMMYSSRTPNGGLKATTHFKVLDKNANYSLLEVKLETGRKNQIRVHMQDLGHSIIGDKKYGATKNPLKRLGLHARVLVFKHPVTEETLHFETPIPKDFLRLFSQHT